MRPAAAAVDVVLLLRPQVHDRAEQGFHASISVSCQLGLACFLLLRLLMSCYCCTRRSMTALNKVFMLPADALLNMSTMRAILASGHSRIPVHTSGDRSSIIGLILVKELLQYKTHQEVPVSEVRMRSLPR
jgi:Mg2+/Co2+ transporter CorB